jgi:hypothetical protein
VEVGKNQMVKRVSQEKLSQEILTKKLAVSQEMLTKTL